MKKRKILNTKGLFGGGTHRTEIAVVGPSGGFIGWMMMRGASDTWNNLDGTHMNWYLVENGVLFPRWEKVNEGSYQTILYD